VVARHTHNESWPVSGVGDAGVTADARSVETATRDGSFVVARNAPGNPSARASLTHDQSSGGT